MVKEDYTKVLKEYIKPNWLEGQILLEDNATEYGTDSFEDDFLPQLKRTLGINCRADPANSPDLNPIEKVWRVVKQ